MGVDLGGVGGGVVFKHLFILYFLQIMHIDEKIDDIHKVLVLLTKNESASRNQSSFE